MKYPKCISLSNCLTLTLSTYFNDVEECIEGSQRFSSGFGVRVLKLILDDVDTFESRARDLMSEEEFVGVNGRISEIRSFASRISDYLNYGTGGLDKKQAVSLLNSIKELVSDLMDLANAKTASSLGSRV